MYYYDQLIGRYAGSQDATMDDNPLVNRQKVTAGDRSRGPYRPTFPCAIGDDDGEQALEDGDQLCGPDIGEGCQGEAEDRAESWSRQDHDAGTGA